MTVGKAVRIPDELHALLSARVATHGPIARQVERAVEASLAEVIAVVEERPRRARATVRRAGTARASAPARACLHPVGRRIGDGCGECGATGLSVRR